MSENEKKENPKNTRRSIPRYTGFRKGNIQSKDSEIQHVQQTHPHHTHSEHKQNDKVDTGGGMGMHKHDKVKKNSKQKHELSLQGPFRPSIVGTRKPEEKRKRNDSADRPDAGILPNVKSFEELSPKRNQTQETLKQKTRCKVEFNTEAETKFSNDTGTKSTLHKFHAKGSKHLTGMSDLRKNNKELQGNVFHLEECLSQMRHQKASEASSLKTQLQSAEEKQKEMEEKVKEMKEEILQKDLHHSDQAQQLLSENKELSQAVSDCRQKLQACNIDPVSLKSMEFSEEEHEEFLALQQESQTNAESLQQTLTEMSEKQKMMILNVKAQYKALQELDFETL